MNKRKVAVLGATGSIGKSTVDVLRAAGDFFEPVLFSAHSNREGLDALAGEFPGALIALSGGGNGRDFSDTRFGRGKYFSGEAGLFEAISRCGADIAVNGIAGAAGLRPSLAALESGCDLALANKETVVMAWDIVSAKAAERGAKIIPVDSEHSAIFSLINAHCGAENNFQGEIILTASGGPFRNFGKDELAKVKAEDALAHPVWKMGKKITIDSASLANKGLEVIEAVRLFNVPSGRVNVVIHPQSVVHSMIRLPGGPVYAEMSNPDMRLPVHKALFYPESVPCPFARLDFDPLDLTFEKPDSGRFPMLALAFQIADSKGGHTIAFNAANEIAVDAFLSGRTGFYGIPELCGKVLENDWSHSPENIEEVFETDARARRLLFQIAPELKPRCHSSQSGGFPR